MPAVTQVTLFDDAAWPERVLASEVVRLTVHRQAVNGPEHSQEVIELYLDTASWQELEADLKRWFALGHRPGTKGLPETAGETKRTKGMRAGPDGTPGGHERRDWKRDLRRWSDSMNLRNRTDPRFPAWKTTTDKHTYPRDLEDAFVAHQAGREDEATALIEQFRPAERQAG